MARLRMTIFYLESKRVLASRRDLLSHAVDGAEAENEVAAVHANDFAVEEILGEDIERDAVVRIVENRNKDKFVGDIEIRVAGGETLAVEENRRGHGEFFDTKLPAGLI